MAPFDVLARAELLDFASENNEVRHVFGLRTPQIRSPAQSLEAFTLHETPSPPYTARAPRISGIDLFVMAITAPWPPPHDSRSKSDMIFRHTMRDYTQSSSGTALPGLLSHHAWDVRS
jgi:hypothetical protein